MLNTIYVNIYSKWARMYFWNNTSCIFRTPFVSLMKSFSRAKSILKLIYFKGSKEQTSFWNRFEQIRYFSSSVGSITLQTKERGRVKMNDFVTSRECVSMTSHECVCVMSHECVSVTSHECVSVTSHECVSDVTLTHFLG